MLDFVVLGAVLNWASKGKAKFVIVKGHLTSVNHHHENFQLCYRSFICF